MSSLRQLLNADNFARVQPGETWDQGARAPAARPREPWELKGEGRADLAASTDANRSQLFSVFYDRAGLVLRTSIGDDPREQACRPGAERR